MNAVAVTPRSARSRLNWFTVMGGLITIGLVALFVRELPAIRRELHIMSM